MTIISLSYNKNINSKNQNINMYFKRNNHVIIKYITGYHAKSYCLSIDINVEFLIITVKVVKKY